MTVTIYVRRRRLALSKKSDGRFQAGPTHPRALDLEKRLRDLQAMDLGTLTVEGPIWRDSRSRLHVWTHCRECQFSEDRLVDNLWHGRTKTCRCRRGKKYDHPEAHRLADRYHAMTNRCDNPLNPSYDNYGGRGITYRFRSAYEYITYILAHHWKESYDGYDVDRRDNDGHYEPGNIRLVPRAVNARNKSNNVVVAYRGRSYAAVEIYDLLKADYPEFALSRAWTERLARGGWTPEEILTRSPS